MLVKNQATAGNKDKLQDRWQLHIATKSLTLLTWKQRMWWLKASTKGKHYERPRFNDRLPMELSLLLLLVRSMSKWFQVKISFSALLLQLMQVTMYYLINTSTVNRISKWNSATSATKLNSITLTVLWKQWQWLHTQPERYQHHGLWLLLMGTEKINADLFAAPELNISGVFKTQNENQPWTVHFCNKQHKWRLGDSKQLMQSSDMAQKDMILRIVSSNSDAEAREMEIKRWAKAYTEIAAKACCQNCVVLQSLLIGEKTGRSDERKISALLHPATPDSLSVEEILHAASKLRW